MIAFAIALAVIGLPSGNALAQASASVPVRNVASRASDRARHKAPIRLVVSLGARRVWAIAGRDTLLSAPAAVAKGTTLKYAGQSWTFTMPRGVRRVEAKNANPIWTPPDWMYAETAKRNDLKLARLETGQTVRLSDGRKLTVRRGRVGLIDSLGFAPLPIDEHIVFDDKLYIPPLGTKNRRVENQLGKYALDLGDGFMLHGTPAKSSIGRAATHGCLRLGDEDIQWLYKHVPVGTTVTIR